MRAGEPLSDVDANDTVAQLGVSGGFGLDRHSVPHHGTIVPPSKEGVS